LIRLALVFLTLLACLFPQAQGRLCLPDGTSPTLPGVLPFSITDIGLLQEIHNATCKVPATCGFRLVESFELWKL
jgi:hypothetical protein